MGRRVESARLLDPFNINSINIYALEHILFALGFSSGCKSPKECIQKFLSSKSDRLLIPDFLLKDEYLYVVCSEIYFWEKGTYAKNKEEIQQWLLENEVKNEENRES